VAWLGRPLAGAARRHLGAAVRGAGALAVTATSGCCFGPFCRSAGRWSAPAGVS